MKKCSGCGQLKEESEFSWKSKSKGKLQPRCKPCQTAYNRNYYHTSGESEKQKKRVAERKRKQIQWFKDWKEGQSCVVCGEDERVALDLHHLNEDHKSYTPSQMSRDGVSIKTMQEEIDKCVVLCANCHRKHHGGVLDISPYTS